MKFKIFIPPTRSLLESLVLHITFNKSGANFRDRKFRQFRKFYTYLHELLSRDFQILQFKKAKNSSKTTGNFLSLKLVILGMYFAKNFVFITFIQEACLLPTNLEKVKIGFSQ